MYTNRRFFFRSMPRGHGTLERQSTQSALSIQQWAFYTTLYTSKNSGTSFCLLVFKWKIVQTWTQNHCVLGLVEPFVLFCSCFLISTAPGIDSVLRTEQWFFKARLAGCPKLFIKKCVHTIGLHGNDVDLCGIVKKFSSLRAEEWNRAQERSNLFSRCSKITLLLE